MEQLAFQIGEEFLDLKPGTELELEEENPFLQLNDSIIGPYTFPFEVPNTEKNIRLLGYHTALFSKKRVSVENVICWENGIQHSIGTLRLEQINGDINDLLTGTSSLYFLTGSSSFWTQIEKKKLQDVDFGGERSFTNPNTNTTGGFFQHVHQAMQGNSSTHDYAFFPVKNNGIKNQTGSFTAEYMNRTAVVSGQVRITFNSFEGSNNPIYPFPYLVYVMKRIFLNFGWKVDGEFFNDPDIKKIVLLSLRDIKWGWKTLVFSPRLYDPVKFDLADFMPNVDISSFLIALKNRLGLYYDFNTRKKTCTIIFLKDVANESAEDISSMTSTKFGNKLEPTEKLYKLVNEFDSGDSLPVKGDLLGREFIGSFLFVPPFAASEINDGKIYLRLAENAYYICREDTETEGNWEWIKYMDNIYDYAPKGSSEDITSAATTTAMTRVTAGGLDMMMPEVNQGGSWEFWNNSDPDFGIRMLFFHGMQPDFNGVLYPYASNHPYNCAGTKLCNFALSYEFQEAGTGVQIGLYHKFWKPLLDYLKQPETVSVDVNYPFSEKGKVRFGASKIINHTKYFVKKKTTILPYNGVIRLELIKI